MTFWSKITPSFFTMGSDSWSALCHWYTRHFKTAQQLSHRCPNETHFVTNNITYFQSICRENKFLLLVSWDCDHLSQRRSEPFTSFSRCNLMRHDYSPLWLKSFAFYDFKLSSALLWVLPQFFYYRIIKAEGFITKERGEMELSVSYRGSNLANLASLETEEWRFTCLRTCVYVCVVCEKAVGRKGVLGTYVHWCI